MKALERDPSRRFGSAKEMMAELRRVAIRDELMASTPEVAARVRATVGRQLAQRRLFVLESGRSAGGPVNAARDTASDAGVVPTPEVRRSKPARSAVRHPVPEAEPPRSESPHSDDTPRRSIGRSLLILVSVLSVLAVIAAAIWPEDAKDLLSRVTSGSGWRTLDGDPAAPE
jgi:hypothetical protein